MSRLHVSDAQTGPARLQGVGCPCVLASVCCFLYTIGCWCARTGSTGPGPWNRPLNPHRRCPLTACCLYMPRKPKDITGGNEDSENPAAASWSASWACSCGFDDNDAARVECFSCEKPRPRVPSNGQHGHHHDEQTPRAQEMKPGSPPSPPTAEGDST
jgi:hypothetical protein